MLRIRISVDYGEGATKAMSRIFSAVLETTGDVSIFNWCGKLLQSPGHGRSLYPADYNAFRNVRSAEKPAYATSPIRVDYVGVNARFEICEFQEIAFGPGTNDEMLEMVSQMRKVVHGSVRASPRHTDVGINIYGMFPDGKSLSLDVICALEGLEAVLRRRKKWVMARFAKLETAHWWLCEMDKVTNGLETYARRIATGEVEQGDIPKGSELFQQVDMWVR